MKTAGESVDTVHTRAAVRIETVEYHDSVGVLPANGVADRGVPRILFRRSFTTAFPASWES